MSPVELGPTTIEFPGAYGHGQLEGLPLSGVVTSPFGPRDPIWTPSGWTTDFHSGADIWRWDVNGAPILAPAPCVVKGSYQDGAGGQTVGVEFEDGTGALFIHMQGLQAGVGNHLRRGDLIGLVGTTGLSTGPHLHYMRMRYCGDGPTWYPREALMDPLSPEAGHVPVISEPPPEPLPDVIEGYWPPPGGGAYVVTTAETTAEYIVAQASREGCQLASMNIIEGGVWLDYIVGAPSAINADFPNPVPALRAIFVRAA